MKLIACNSLNSFGMKLRQKVLVYVIVMFGPAALGWFCLTFINPNPSITEGTQVSQQEIK